MRAWHPARVSTLAAAGWCAGQAQGHLWHHITLSAARHLNRPHPPTPRPTHRFSWSSTMLPLMLPMAQHSRFSGAHPSSRPLSCACGRETGRPGAQWGIESSSSSGASMSGQAAAGSPNNQPPACASGPPAPWAPRRRPAPHLQAQLLQHLLLGVVVVQVAQVHQRLVHRLVPRQHVCGTGGGMCMCVCERAVMHSCTLHGCVASRAR